MCIRDSAKDIYRPAEMSEDSESGESSALKDAKAWQAKKYDSGWACLHWPKDYGGRDAAPMERVIWGQEESKFKVPGGFFEIGQGMAGPVLMLYASEGQKVKKFGVSYSVSLEQVQIWLVSKRKLSWMVILGPLTVKKFGLQVRITAIMEL